jgi:hypothetical protein
MTAAIVKILPAKVMVSTEVATIAAVPPSPGSTNTRVALQNKTIQHQDNLVMILTGENLRNITSIRQMTSKQKFDHHGNESSMCQVENLFWHIVGREVETVRLLSWQRAGAIGEGWIKIRYLFP